MPSSRLIIEQLLRGGITHVVALPDNTSRALLDALSASSIRVVGVTREGEAWATASGLWMGGATPAVLMQNTGFLESGDALRGTAMRMRIPLLCLLTYRGYATLPRPGPADASTQATDARLLSDPAIDSCAVVFEPTLRAWGLPYEFVHADADVSQVAAALELARSREHPAAVLLTRETTP